MMDDVYLIVTILTLIILVLAVGVFLQIFQICIERIRIVSLNLFILAIPWRIPCLELILRLSVSILLHLVAKVALVLPPRLNFHTILVLVPRWRVLLNHAPRFFYYFSKNGLKIRL